MAHQLAYAPIDAWYRRRRRAILVAIFIAIVLCMGISLMTIPVMMNRLRAMSAQRAVENFIWPPNKAVYTEVDYGESRGPESDGLMETRGEQPGEWYALYAASSSTIGGDALPQTTIFMHQLDVPGRAPRIVRVSCIARRFDHDNQTLHCIMRVIQPGTIWSPPHDLWVDQTSLFLPNTKTAITIYGGQLDPADPRHFTIRYTFGQGQQGIVDGWLCANDQMMLQPRP